MQISKDTEEIIKFMQEFCGNNLRKPDDIASLLELTASNNDFDTIYNLLLIGKSAWNLQLTIRKNQKSDSIELLYKELEKSLNELRIQLNRISDYALEETISRFEKIYLPDSEGALRNLLDLAHDLSILKDIQNLSKENREK